MIIYRYRADTIPKCHYDDIFCAMPRGKANAITPEEFSAMLEYDYGITQEDEALRVIRCMQADGYIIIEDNGKFYRAENYKELAEVYGYNNAYRFCRSLYWYA